METSTAPREALTRPPGGRRCRYVTAMGRGGLESGSGTQLIELVIQPGKRATFTCEVRKKPTKTLGGWHLQRIDTGARSSPQKSPAQPEITKQGNAF